MTAELHKYSDSRGKAAISAAGVANFIDKFYTPLLNTGSTWKEYVECNLDSDIL